MDWPQGRKLRKIIEFNKLSKTNKNKFYKKNLLKNQIKRIKINYKRKINLKMLLNKIKRNPK